MMQDDEYMRMLAELAGYKDHPGAQGSVDAVLLAKNERWKETLPRYLKFKTFANEADSNPFLPGPTDEEVGQGDLEIGRLVRGSEPGGPFRPSLSVLGEHQLWTGHGGSGKSFGIMHELSQLIGRVAVWIFDTEDEYKNLVHIVAPGQLLLLDYKDFRRNIFEPPPGFHPLEWQGRVKNNWRESFFLRDGSVNLLGDVTHDLFESRGILEGSTNYVTLQEFYRKLASLKFRVNSRNAGYWETLMNRTLNLLNFMGPTYNCVRGHDLEYLLEKSVVFRLRGLSDDLFCFFANDLLSYVMASREPLVGGELRNIFVFDEAHRLFSPVRSDRSDLTEPIAFQAVRTIRKRGVGLIIGDQVPHLLPPAIRANLGTRVVLRLVDGNSVRAMSDSLSLSPDQRAYLLELEKRQAVVQYSGYSDPFLIELPEIDLGEILKAGADKPLPTTADEIPGFVDGGDRPVVSQEQENHESRLNESVSKDAIDYLTVISRNIFLPVTKRDKLLNKSGWKGNARREELANSGLISLRRINTYIRGGHVIVAEITDKGYEFLDRLKVKYERPRGKGGLEHKFWQYTIASWAHKCGYKAVIEEYRNGKSVDVGLEIDGRAIACEVLICGEKKELFNLEKDALAGWNEIWFCSGAEEQARKLRPTLESIPCEGRKAKIEVKLLQHFLETRNN